MQGAEITAKFFQLLIGVGPYMLIFVAGALVGSMVPTYYAAERLRGFGRFVMKKVPYEPPPGKEKGEALEDATTHEKKTPEGDDEGDSDEGN